MAATLIAATVAAGVFAHQAGGAPITAAAPGDRAGANGANLVVDPAVSRRRAGVPHCHRLATIDRGRVRFAPLPGGRGAAIAIRRTSPRGSAMATQAPACAPAVRSGRTYRVALRYKGAGALGLQVLRRELGEWRPWYLARAGLRSAARLTRVSAVLPALPRGVDGVAFGILVRGRGRATSDGFSITDVTASAADPAPAAAPPAQPPAEAPPPPRLTTAEATGRWTVLPTPAPVRSIHAILLQTGKVLLMAGSGNDPMSFEAGTFRSYVYDPVKHTFQSIATPKDVFCTGHVQLANGNVLVIGGTSGYPDPSAPPGSTESTAYKGQNAAWIFNIRTNAYEPVTRAGQQVPPLLGGAWYPSATLLGNGDVIAFGGLDENAQGRTRTDYFTDPANAGADNDLPGEFVGFGSSKLQQTYPWYWGEYPSMILAADGRLFYSGSHVFGNGIQGTAQAPSGSSLYRFICNPGADREFVAQHPETDVAFRVQDTPGLRVPDLRDQSASLLLPPAQDQRVMILGGGNTYTTLAGSGRSATGLTDLIDLRDPNPHWVPGPDLPRGVLDDGSLQPAGTGKMYVSAVALPDGRVLETGGSMHMRADDVHEASIFDPATNTFTPVNADPVGRDYHSEALLLPDGRVLAIGSNPGDGSFEMRVSVYEPPYLFRGPRPVLASIDAAANSVAPDGTTRTTQWEYGSSHTLQFSSSAPVASAMLIRPAAVTHSSDPNQRAVALPVTSRSAGQVTVQLTPNSNIAPPGYYMVFLLDDRGVPSEARWVHVGPQGAPTP